MNTVGFDCSALDPSFKEHAQRGIGRYVRELSRYFEVSGTHDSEIKVGRFDHTQLRGGIVDRLVDLSPLGRQTLRQQLIYPLRLSGRCLGDFQILHFPAHMDAPAWTYKPYVLTVLDLIPLVLADLYKADRSSWRFEFARWLEIRAIKNASLVLAISENTARDVTRVLGIPQERIVVTPLGVDTKFFSAFNSDRAVNSDLLSRLGVPSNRQIVLYVGGIDQRKNIGFMLEAFAELKSRFLHENKVPPLLMLVGKIEQDRQFPALIKNRERLDLIHDVLLGGFVSDQELLSLYSSSDVFFFPSLYEGFGLPVLEAMAAGLPVVSSAASSMPEVIGDTGLTFDPNDLKAAVEQLYLTLTDKNISQRNRTLAHRRAGLFTWERTGEATIAAYRAALQGRGCSVIPEVVGVHSVGKPSSTDLYGSRRDIAHSR